jgi:hypothetical protein
LSSSFSNAKHHSKQNNVADTAHYYCNQHKTQARECLITDIANFCLPNKRLMVAAAATSAAAPC